MLQGTRVFNCMLSRNTSEKRPRIPWMREWRPTGIGEVACCVTQQRAAELGLEPELLSCFLLSILPPLILKLSLGKATNCSSAILIFLICKPLS